jgi:hypothetical protein
MNSCLQLRRFCGGPEGPRGPYLAAAGPSEATPRVAVDLTAPLAVTDAEVDLIRQHLGTLLDGVLADEEPQSRAASARAGNWPASLRSRAPRRLMTADRSSRR